MDQACLSSKQIHGVTDRFGASFPLVKSLQNVAWGGPRMTDIADLIRLQTHIKNLIAYHKRQDTLSGKDYSDLSQKQVQKNGADLSWLGMDIEKAMHEAHAAAVDCGIADPRAEYGTIDFRPSAFHQYRYTPTLPCCRQGGKP